MADEAPAPDRLHVFATRDAACDFAAARLAQAIARASGTPRVVLGLATGRTPIGVYARLVQRHRAGLSFAHVETFNLDEYWPLAPSHPASFHRFMHEHLFDHIDLPRDARHVPNGAVPAAGIDAHCRAYEALIARAGGIDMQLLGIGANGHVGFNEPGTPHDARTRLVALHARTRADNAAAFHGLEHMPTHAITLGIGTIMEARAIVVLALGAAKADATRAALLGPRTPALPASLLRAHAAVTWVLDREAAAGLAELPDPPRAR